MIVCSRRHTRIRRVRSPRPARQSGTAATLADNYIITRAAHKLALKGESELGRELALDWRPPDSHPFSKSLAGGTLGRAESRRLHLRCLAPESELKLRLRSSPSKQSFAPMETRFGLSSGASESIGGQPKGRPLDCYDTISSSIAVNYLTRLGRPRRGQKDSSEAVKCSSPLDRWLLLVSS